MPRRGLIRENLINYFKIPWTEMFSLDLCAPGKTPAHDNFHSQQQHLTMNLQGDVYS